ncbi:MAG: hypothetical protein ACLTS6_13130 [Anaerobutyricum sp.]
MIFKNVWNYTSVSTIMGSVSSRDIDTIVFIHECFPSCLESLKTVDLRGSKSNDMEYFRNIDTGRGIFRIWIILSNAYTYPFIGWILTFGYNEWLAASGFYTFLFN